MTTTTSTTDLYMETIDVLAGAGFLPIDDTEELNAKGAKIVRYFAVRHGFDAFRLDDDGFTFVRYGEDGIDLLATTPTGVTTADASFNMNAMGVRWLAGAIK